jgi:Prokaryotic RING finger family 1
MSVIVTCSCNARLRLPEERLGQRMRCPRCQAEVVPTADNQVITLQDGESVGVGGSCPICQSPIEPDDVSLKCPECQQVHHRECWAEVGGCSTYGCPKAPALVKEEAADTPRTAWGDTKKCPMCAETIKSIALRCRYCGTDFDTVDPLTVRDLKKKDRKKETVQGVQKSVWVLFVLSLIGCLAPILFFVNLIWLLTKRGEIAKAGPFYTVLGCAALTITVIFNVLILIFAVTSNQ